MLQQQRFFVLTIGERKMFNIQHLGNIKDGLIKSNEKQYTEVTYIPTT